MSSTSSVRATHPSGQKLVIRFPQCDDQDIAQDDEWCEVVDGHRITRVRFHDYAHSFSIPGLYDQLFGGANSETKCISPQIMVGLLKDNLHHVLRNGWSSEQAGHDELRVLDFGAGNGMIGEEIRLLCKSYGTGYLANSTSVVGFDILSEAKMAAERDRPGVYDAYVVADVAEYVKNLGAKPEQFCLAGFNVLVSVSALSFGDASAATFKAAISLVQNGGLVLFNLKAGLLDNEDSEGQGDGMTGKGTDNGFSKLVQQAVAEGEMEILARKTYCHRFSVTGKPLHYEAVAAMKHAPLS